MSLIYCDVCGELRDADEDDRALYDEARYYCGKCVEEARNAAVPEFTDDEIRRAFRELNAERT